MERVFRHAQWLLVRGCLLLAVAVAVVGCKSACSTGDCASGHCCHHPDACIDNCADIPKGAIPQPLGTFSNEILNRQVEKGQADAYVIYYNEWLVGEAVLGPYGSDHLIRMVARLPDVPFPIIMQPEPNQPILNGLRHSKLIDALAKAGIADPQKRVLIGQSWGEGLFGDEAERIYPQLVRGGTFNGNGYGGNFNGYGGSFAGGYGTGFGGFSGVSGFPGGNFGFR